MQAYNYTHIPERSTDKVDVYSFPPLNICFVGPRGVGKTSMLASMSQELKKGRCSDIFIDQQTTAGRFTSKILGGAWEDMLSIFDDTEMGQMVKARGLGGTSNAYTGEDAGGREFIFTGRFSKKAAFKTKSFLYPFRFIDLPGKWYDHDADEKETDKVNKILGSSMVSFLTVDTPAMMKGMSMHVRKNRPDKIYDFYNTAMPSFQHNFHLVVIVLARCEAYWDKKELLLEKVKDRYADVISLLQKNEIPIAVVPVQTLGGIKFQEYNPEGEAQFIRTGMYKPDNCVTPLRLALTGGLINSIIKMKEGRDGLLDELSDLFGCSHYDIAREGAIKLAEELLNIDDKDAWFL